MSSAIGKPHFPTAMSAVKRHSLQRGYENTSLTRNDFKLKNNNLKRYKKEQQKEEDKNVRVTVRRS